MQCLLFSFIKAEPLVFTTCMPIWISKSQEYMMKECVLQECMMKELGIVACPEITAKLGCVLQECMT